MTNQPLIECVPNFSEGRDLNIIRQITDAIAAVDGVTLLDVDPGKATNRTVVTFVGHPKAVIEGAFQGIKKAGELIDMSQHKGEHPRMGATDVCPLIPIANITMEETVAYAKMLGERVGKELDIPIYLYEAAATTPERKNLATIRSGEYEALSEKLTKPEWKPDFGQAKFNIKSGATVIGARDFLIAYNVNINSKSVKLANAIAFDVREQGRIKREGDPVTGKIVKDKEGNSVRIPGTCKSVKAIGWYIEEYGLAQISMNLTNIEDTSLHKAFEECSISAHNRGMRVTGSELVGMVPIKVLLDAGKYFFAKQNRSTGVSREELIDMAIKSLGLNELSPFDPQKKIIEFAMKSHSSPLVKMNLREFANETASESPAPGGGSIAAYMGSLGASLGTMVANLSATKREWEANWPSFIKWAEQGQALKDQLLDLVDEDTNAFNKVMDAFKLPKENPAEIETRKAAIEEANKYAMQVPFKTMEISFQTFPLIEEMIKNGNPNSITDVGVAALSARSAVYGAYLNVKINASGIKDKAFVEAYMSKADALLEKTLKKEAELLALVGEKLL